MSLAQHVSSIDGIDRGAAEPEEDIDIAPEFGIPIRRKISYDVFPQPHLEQVPKARSAAYNVSVAKRLAQVAVTILACWVSAGIVFGFAALKPVLISEGVYRGLCTDDELREGVDVCYAQDLRLNLFFTIASITANVSALPVGTILDRYGFRICYFAGCILLAIGSLLMSFSFSRPHFDGYTIGNFFLALGGTFIFVPSFQIANAFPKRAGTIVALVTGAFDASAAVFLIYRILYNTSHGTFSPDTFFLGYLIVPGLILLSLLTLLPAHDYHSVYQLEVKVKKAEDATRDVHDSDDEIESSAEVRRIRKKRAEKRHDRLQKIDSLLGDRDETRRREEHQEEIQEASGVWGALHGQPARKQMASPWFILITLMTVLQMLRMNYFIATIDSQYEYMLGSMKRSRRITGLFDVALPVGGVVSTPFIGMLLDRLSVPTTLAIIVILTTAIGILNSIPSIWAGYLTVILFVLLRPLYYSAMSDYATKVFGFATFGRVYGTIICLSGLVNFSQYGLDFLTHGPFHENPIPINIFLAASGFVVGVVLVGYVTVAGKRMRKQREEEEEDEERQRLIPEEDEEE